MSNIIKNQTSQKPSRIVILGANGFVASHLTQACIKQELSYLTVGKNQIDLTQTAAADKLSSLLSINDTVIMASALTPDKGKDRATMLKNVAMADSVATALEKVTVNHFILISSDAVYSDSLTLINESSATDPSSLYGVGHITREKILQECTSRLKIPFLTLRPCAIYGTGDTHNSYGPNRFAKTARETKKISLFGAGIDKRDHLNVTDFCEIILAAAACKASGVLNVASGESLSFFDVANLIATSLGGNITIETQTQSANASYRHFDITELIKTFPKLPIRLLKTGVYEI